MENLESLSGNATAQMEADFDYKSLLQRFMNVISDWEALNFVTECVDLVKEGEPLFTPAEIQELNRLFDEYEYPAATNEWLTKTQPVG